MSWARPPGAPELPSCPLEALEPKENEYTSLVDKYGIPVILGLAGVFTPVAGNLYLRRPAYTGIWKHITLGIGLAYLGLVVRNVRNEIVDERDEILRQYVTLHPEDFPPYEKKLYKDVLEPWIPRR